MSEWRRITFKNMNCIDFKGVKIVKNNFLNLNSIDFKVNIIKRQSFYNWGFLTFMVKLCALNSSWAAKIFSTKSLNLFLNYLWGWVWWRGECWEDGVLTENDLFQKLFSWGQLCRKWKQFLGVSMFFKASLLILFWRKSLKELQYIAYMKR